MVCFIRDIATWAHVAQCKVASWNVPIFSVEDDTGTVRIEGEHPEYSRCWVILDGNIFYGETASPSDGMTDLTVSRPMNAFDRTLVYSFEAKYEVTSDTERDPDKTYYILRDVNKYHRTEDEAFVDGKTYYERSEEDDGYIETSDESMDEDKYYYEATIVTEYQPATRFSDHFYPGITYYEMVSHYGGLGTEYLESFMANVINDFFAQEEDPMYGMSYLSVIAVGETMVDLGYYKNEVYSFLDIVDLAYEQKILFSFLMTESTLTLLISPAGEEENTIFFGDGHNFLDDVTVSNEIVAKVTVRRIISYDDYIDVQEEKDYYWHKGGLINTTPPVPRLKGIWDIVSIEDDDIDMYIAAEEAMADNNEAVKVSFYSDQVFDLWDKITCLVKDEVITETVSSCSLSSDDPRYLYTIGKMPTTLTEKFEQQAYEKDENTSQDVTYENQSGSYLEKTGGTVGGSINVNDTMTANKMVVGADSYGSTLPEKGTNGQVFFVI